MNAQERAASTSPQERAAFRAFVREHHPDRGGDPEAFVAGMARFARGSGTGGWGPDVEHHGIADDDPRLDAPIEVVRSLPFPVKLAVALLRTVHKQRRVR